MIVPGAAGRAAPGSRAARLSAVLAPRRPGRGRDRVRLSHSAGHGLRRCRGTATGGGPVGDPARVGDLRRTRLVADLVGGPRIDDRPDDGRRHRAARRGPYRAFRGAGRRARDSGWGVRAGRVGGPAWLCGRSALAAGADRLPGRCRAHHGGRAAGEDHRRACQWPDLHRRDHLLRPRCRPRPDRQPGGRGVGSGLPFPHPVTVAPGTRAAACRTACHPGRGGVPAGPARYRCDRHDPGRPAYSGATAPSPR